MGRPAVQYPRSGDTAQNDDRVMRALTKLLPEWARGSTLIRDVEMAAATAFTVAHGLGQGHRGWFVARIVSASDDATVVELPTTDASYNADLAQTHLQLRGTRAATVSLVVF